MKQREYNFRAFNFDTGTMFQVEKTEMDGWCCGFDRQHRYQDIFFKKYGENKPNGVLLQFVGSYDHYGREIYEGDLVQNLQHPGERPYTVAWDEGFYLKRTAPNDPGSDILAPWEIEWDQFLVIGNIYEGVNVI